MLGDYLFHVQSWEGVGLTLLATPASVAKANLGIPYNTTNVDFSIFPIGIGITHTPTGSKVIVGADYSCWCPDLGAFVNAGDTNLRTKLLF